MTRQAAARLQPPADFEDVLVRRARPLMGTLVGVTVRGHHRDGIEQAIRVVFAEMERLEGILSEWRPDSAVSRANQSAGLSRRSTFQSSSSRSCRRLALRLPRKRGSVRHCMGGAVRPVETRRSRLSPASRRRRRGGTEARRLSRYRPRRASTNALPAPPRDAPGPWRHRQGLHRRARG